jgi:thymidylate synthase (FAD)
MTLQQLDMPPNAKVVLPPHGFVALQRHTASDLDVVNAARVSFAKQTAWEMEKIGDTCYCEDSTKTCDCFTYRDRLGETDEKVLRFLLKGKHGTPFEHNFFKWHVRAPIFVFREWHRHRIGVSINEESARYTPLKGDFYVPDRDDIREQHGRPGAYTFERVEDDMKAETVQRIMESQYQEAYAAYEWMMGEGIAKEIARAVLPVGIYSQMIWTCNARSLMNFLSLRNHPTALREIRVYAQAMETEFARIMPITYNAFLENGRIAP